MKLFTLISGLRRRRLVQWVLAYLAGAWVLMQVAALVGEPPSRRNCGNVMPGSCNV